MKWGLNVSQKYLTPSSALTDSRLRSPVHIVAAPKSLFFNASPRLLTWSTARSSQSSIGSSYLNKEVDPSKSGWIFVVIQCAAVHWSVDSARNAPTIDSAVVLGFSKGNHQELRHSHSSVLLRLWTTPTQRNLLLDKIHFFWNNQRSATTLWLLCCSFCADCTGREYSRHQTRTHKIVLILSDMDRYWQDSKMVITRTVSMNSFFVTTHMNENTVCTD